MAGFRIDKMASIIREIVSDAIANKLSDPRISPFASVTRVEMSGDMQIANVFISVLGEAAVGRTTMAGLEKASGRIQRLVARELSVRRCPEVRLLLDESLKKAEQAMRIIDAALREDLGDQIGDETDAPQTPTEPPTEPPTDSPSRMEPTGDGVTE